MAGEAAGAAAVETLRRLAAQHAPPRAVERVRAEDAESIELDLHRAGREELGVSAESAASHRQSLRRVLHGWCEAHPHVGYVQGLNCIAAAALVLLDHREDDACALLDLLHERLPADWYSHSLRGARVEVEALLRLYEARRPELFTCGELRLAVHVAGSGWLLSLFVGSLALDCLALLWAALLSDAVHAGPPGTNLRLALALLRRADAEIGASLLAEVDDAQANTFGIVSRAADGLAADELQRLLREEELPPGEVAEARALARVQVEAEDDAKAARRRERQQASKRKSPLAAVKVALPRVAPPRRCVAFAAAAALALLAIAALVHGAAEWVDWLLVLGLGLAAALTCVSSRRTARNPLLFGRLLSPGMPTSEVAAPSTPHVEASRVDRSISLHQLP
ncbi:hypothetical protein AB1Y20_003501 [Prymnesium parvum]|uniref:Rab-GAP TBC domain-containing protein n=1 Tax=Prymnesium parvum TaxID=97485 RepID=A0AB34JDK9_PRYPA